MCLGCMASSLGFEFRMYDFEFRMYDFKFGMYGRKLRGAVETLLADTASSLFQPNCNRSLSWKYVFTRSLGALRAPTSR